MMEHNLNLLPKLGYHIANPDLAPWATSPPRSAAISKSGEQFMFFNTMLVTSFALSSWMVSPVLDPVLNRVLYFLHHEVIFEV